MIFIKVSFAVPYSPVWHSISIAILAYLTLAANWIYLAFHGYKSNFSHILIVYTDFAQKIERTVSDICCLLKELEKAHCSRLERIGEKSFSCISSPIVLLSTPKIWTLKKSKKRSHARGGASFVTSGLEGGSQSLIQKRLN